MRAFAVERPESQSAPVACAPGGTLAGVRTVPGETKARRTLRAKLKDALRELESPVIARRRGAAQWLSRQARRSSCNDVGLTVAEPSVLEVVLAHTRDADADVAEQCFVAASSIASRYTWTPALRAVAQRFLVSPRERSRVWALAALEFAGTEEDVEAVGECLKDSRPAVRLAAQRTLSALKGARVAKPHVLGVPPWEVRVREDASPAALERIAQLLGVPKTNDSTP